MLWGALYVYHYADLCRYWPDVMLQSVQQSMFMHVK